MTRSSASRAACFALAAVLLSGCASFTQAVNDLGRSIDEYFASLRTVDSREASESEVAEAEAAAAEAEANGGWQTVTAQGASDQGVERVAVPVGESTTAADGTTTVDVVLVDPATGRSDGTVRTVEVDAAGEPADGAAVEVDGFKTVYAKPNK